MNIDLLLEELHNKTGLSYLSDFHREKQLCYQTILFMNINKYTLSQWSAVISYIENEKKTFFSYQEFLNYLKIKKEQLEIKNYAK
ncbi:hypothetical protein [uncultured Robinsoniella sp.]|uniref:hypothetical protein n=1 Tax=uncultured Robinsoniella sp. TaxID=904190 RepID=UPI00374F8039